MAVDPRSPLKTSNGSGHVNGKLNGSTKSRMGQSKKRQSLLSWTISAFARLATWAAIFTVLFRCPPSIQECDETSPFICKHYFRAKDAISPHVQPYYDQYASPYVEIAKPYYDTVNTNILTPTREYAVQYGAPWAAKGRDYAWSQWESNGQPRLVMLQDVSRAEYDRLVAPYLEQANQAIGPYYEIARVNAVQTFYEVLLPSYEFVQPYAIQGYDVASEFATGTALPTAYWTWSKANAFLDSAVWPQLRVIYNENVEPQLVRIGERLGRYKIKAKSKVLKEKSSVVENFSESTAPSSFSKPAPQSPTSVPTTSQTSTAAPLSSASPETASEHRNPVEAPAATENESDMRRKAREMVAGDLEQWQNKFATQAEEGAAEIEDTVDEIAGRMIDINVKTTGRSLVRKLEETIESELGSLKTTISSIAGISDKNADGAQEEAVQAIRKAGVAIKKSAQVIRGWREDYDAQLQVTVVGAADKHFQILDETRSLALQEIGMRWAWTDGITYKDWAKYHELKTTFAQWTEELKELVVTHPTLLEAQDASAQVEDDGMAIASTAARELARLKEVARWKVIARDASDDFDSETTKLAAEAVQRAQEIAQAAEDEASVKAEQAANAASEHLANAASSATDSASSATEIIDDASSSASDSATALAQSVIDSVSSVSETAKEQATTAAEAVKDFVLQEEDETTNVKEEWSSASEEASSTASESIADFVSHVSSVLADASDAAESRVSDAESRVSDAESTISTGSEVTSSIISEAAESASSVSGANIANSASSLASEASEALFGNEDPTFDTSHDEDDETATEEELPEYTPVSEYPEVKPAMFGAAAQAVPNQQPILDDYVDADVVASATNAAQAAYSNAVSKASERYSSAVSIVSAQLYGKATPVHEKLLASVSAAYDDALSAASAKLSAAADGVSAALHATPTATEKPSGLGWERVESIAAQKLNEGRLWAEIQYEGALIAAGLATPTPSSPSQKYYEQAKVNYYAGLGLAQDRYSNFLASASSAWYSAGATPTPTDFSGSASSVLSVASESAVSAARAAGESAESAYSAATESMVSAGQAVDDTVAAVVDAASEHIYDAGAAIAGTFDEAVSLLSSQVYGQPTPIGWYDSVSSEASSYASAATEAVSDGALSVTKAAGDAAVTASSEASKQYHAVNRLVSELLHDREPSFRESVLSRLGDVYTTAVSNVGSLASEATDAASSIGDRVGDAASRATEAVKAGAQHARDEL